MEQQLYYPLYLLGPDAKSCLRGLSELLFKINECIYSGAQICHIFTAIVYLVKGRPLEQIGSVRGGRMEVLKSIRVTRGYPGQYIHTSKAAPLASQAKLI